MLRRFLLGLLVVGAVSTVSAQEDTRTQAIYGHPFITLITLSIEGFPTWVPVTYEKELPNGKSFTLQPMIGAGSFGEGEDAVDLTDITITGAYRNYLNGAESKGAYLAPAAKLGFTKVSDGDLSANFTAISGLVYIGVRGKWAGSVTMYSDVGIGYGVGFGSGDDVDYSSGGLALDLNIGVGAAF